MTIKQLCERWLCSTRQIDLLCEKGILNPEQEYERAPRDFSLKEIEEVEKTFNIVTSYQTMDDFAKRFNLHYMTVYNWVKADKIKSCKLFNPIRIPLTEKPNKRKNNEGDNK